MPQHLLSFVTNESGNMVSIHADLAGVEFMIQELEYLRDQIAKEDCPHTHLFSIGTPTDELSATKLSNQKNEVQMVGHVKIYGWTDEVGTKA